MWNFCMIKLRSSTVMSSKIITFSVVAHLYKRTLRICLMISLLLNLLLFAQAQSKIVYIRLVRDPSPYPKPIDPSMLKLLEFDIADLVSRNFVANYCKNNEFGSIVSETYDTFMNESSEFEQCFNDTKTKLIKSVCKTKNKYFDEQDLDEHITWDYLVKCCIKRRDVLCSFDKDSKSFKDYSTFLKFYIATMWKYGVYKAVMKPFYSILIDKSKIKPEDYDKCVSDFGPYVDLKHKELLAEFLSTEDPRCKIFDIQNLSNCENKRDVIVEYINQYACDDKALLVCSLFTIKILNEIKKHCNENPENGSDEWYSPKYMRIGSKILKDESAMIKSGHRTSFFHPAS